MVRQAVCFLLVTVLFASPAAGSTSGSILGEWLALKRTKEGLGISKTYGKDGSLLATYGALHDYRYNLTGNKLVLSSPPDEPSVLYVEIKGAKLVLSDLAGNRQKFTRVSGDGTSGIIGKWSGKNQAGRNQIMHFTASRNCFVSEPILSEKKTYSVKATNLTEAFKGKTMEEWQWGVDEGILTLTNPAKETTERYRRKE